MLKKWLYRFSFYFTRRFYVLISSIVALFILAFFIDALMDIAAVILLCVSLALTN